MAYVVQNPYPQKKNDLISPIKKYCRTTLCIVLDCLNLKELLL